MDCGSVAASMSSIFQNSRFYFLPEITQDTQNVLQESILELGGEIVPDILDANFTVADLVSGCHHPQLLQLSTLERRVVPLSYVASCRAVGTQLKPIFLDDGTPMNIHLHQNVGDSEYRKKLCERIMEHAGYPYATFDSARVVIADEAADSFKTLARMLQPFPGKYIESSKWVEMCIEEEDIIFTAQTFKNTGGRRMGERGTPFSDEDEHKLCEWIAGRTLRKFTGGKVGNKLYLELFEKRNDPEYGWVSRHSWQSWRERYKKNKKRLDPIIAGMEKTTKNASSNIWQRSSGQPNKKIADEPPRHQGLELKHWAASEASPRSIFHPLNAPRISDGTNLSPTGDHGDS